MVRKRLPQGKFATEPFCFYLIPNARMITEQQRFLRVRGVSQKTSLATSTIWKKVREKQFPAPVHLGPQVTCWVESEIDDWMNQKIEASRSQNQAA
jgi:prophage regulatory protein